MLNVFVLTYAGSKFQPEFLGDSRFVNSYRVIENTFDMGFPVRKARVLSYQAQIASFELYRLVARAFTREQVSRSVIAALGLLSFPFSSKQRAQSERAFLKSQAVRNGHELIWNEALRSNFPCLVLEDDASLSVDREALFESLLDFTFELEQPFGVELSQSYSFSELGILESHIGFFKGHQIVGDWYKVFPGASNTTCAAFYSQATISRLKAFSTKSKFKLLPIDYFIDYFYLRNRDIVRNYHVIPGPFSQGSEFREAP